MADSLTSAESSVMCTKIRRKAGQLSRLRSLRLSVLPLLVLLATPEPLSGQRRGPDTAAWSDAGDIYWGGSINVRFGRTSGIGLYPLVGYKITPRWSAGVRLGYEFWWRSRFSETLTSHAVSGSVFSRYRIIPQIYAHAEGGAGNYDRSLFTEGGSRVTYPFLFLGGGFSQPLSRRSWLLFEVLYEVIQDVNSPYDGGGPLISVGFGVGF